MKQLIVLLATIILGLAIGAIITGFSNDATTISDNVTSRMEKTVSSSAIGSWE